MRHNVYHDFDQFAESVHDVERKMMLRNPARRSWNISGVEVGDVDVQCGQLCSGNIAHGQLRDDGYMFYLPSTDGIEYVSKGTSFGLDSCVVTAPGSEFFFSTKAARDWTAILVPNHYFEALGTRIDTPTRTCRVANG